MDARQWKNFCFITMEMCSNFLGFILMFRFISEIEYTVGVTPWLAIVIAHKCLFILHCRWCCFLFVSGEFVKLYHGDWNRARKRETASMRDCCILHANEKHATNFPLRLQSIVNICYIEMKLWCGDLATNLLPVIAFIFDDIACWFRLWEFNSNKQ